jgi:hypothetical protein
VSSKQPKFVYTPGCSTLVPKPKESIDSKVKEKEAREHRKELGKVI